MCASKSEGSAPHFVELLRPLLFSVISHDYKRQPTLPTTNPDEWVTAITSSSQPFLHLAFQPKFARDGSYDFQHPLIFEGEYMNCVWLLHWFEGLDSSYFDLSLFEN
jgi:hypothetical protein